jgi:hypothetical protein
VSRLARLPGLRWHTTEQRPERALEHKRQGRAVQRCATAANDRPVNGDRRGDRHAGFVYPPVMHDLFGSAPLDAVAWAEATLAALVVLPTVAAEKAWRRRA